MAVTVAATEGGPSAVGSCGGSEAARVGRAWRWTGEVDRAGGARRRVGREGVEDLAATWGGGREEDLVEAGLAADLAEVIGGLVDGLA